MEQNGWKVRGNYSIWNGWGRQILRGAGGGDEVRFRPKFLCHLVCHPVSLTNGDYNDIIILLDGDGYFRRLCHEIIGFQPVGSRCFDGRTFQPVGGGLLGQLNYSAPTKTLP